MDTWVPSERSGFGVQSGSAVTGHDWQRFPGLGNINQCMCSQKYSYQHQDACSYNCWQVSVLDIPCQTTSKTGIYPCQSADRVPNVILSSQASKQTTWCVPAFQREKTQLCLLEIRYFWRYIKSLLQGSLQKPQEQIHLFREDNWSKKEIWPCTLGKQTMLLLLLLSCFNRAWHCSTP